MRRAFFFIVAIVFATSSLASIPRASMHDRASEDASALVAPLAETRIRASEVLAPFERPADSELTRALRQAYEHPSTTNASGLRCFLSVDPVWVSTDLRQPQSWNRYSYVRNNPINRIDPDGRADVEIKYPAAAANWTQAQKTSGTENGQQKRRRQELAMPLFRQILPREAVASEHVWKRSLDRFQSRRMQITFRVWRQTGLMMRR
ncbi:MAG TPA: RHS repeat-associated core domain-containing protein [Thermoanaerobaculia bacterium]|jgi:RHS repeat-associated protein